MSQHLSQTQSGTQTTVQETYRMTLATALEMPLEEWDEHVKEEMMENAALEENDPSLEHEDHSDAEDNDFDDSKAGEYSEMSMAMADYLNADDAPDYLREHMESKSDIAGGTQVSTTSFYEELLSQISEQALTEHEQQLLAFLIGSLEEDGYLRKELTAIADELAIYHNVSTTEEELKRMLAVLHTFEPRGIGARTLKECLLLQLSEPDFRSSWKELAIKVVKHHFTDFTQRRWDHIKEKMNLDAETTEQVKRVLTHLNPVPGRALGEEATIAAPTIIPDFFVYVERDGHVDIQLNNGDSPELRVSKSFLDSLKEFNEQRDHLSNEQKEVYLYTRQKVESAVNFISMIKKREHGLLSVMEAIVALQRPFFDDDDEAQLRPMVLKEVAEWTGMSISSVSRIVTNKYVQTRYGVYPLKFFFSLQHTNREGITISPREVKAALQQLISEEDTKNPLRDEALAQRLQQMGFQIARRTVMKYREQLKIPAARFRRK